MKVGSPQGSSDRRMIPPFKRSLNVLVICYKEIKLNQLLLGSGKLVYL